MNTRVALSFVLVPLLAACSSSSPSPSTAPAPTRDLSSSLSQSSTRFAHKVSLSAHAAKMREPWTTAAATVAPAAATNAGASPERASSTYPAFAPDAPQVVDNGAPTLSNMKIATMTWNADPLADALEAFGDGIGATAYWKAIAEYGIGPTASGFARHFRGTNFPATITDAQLDALVRSSVGSAAAGWPANEAQLLYALYLPPTTTFLVDNGNGTTTPACQLFGGYHTATFVANADGGAAQPIIYAVMPRCPGFNVDTVSEIASHEFGEAASDSFSNGVAYVGFDPDHLAYDIYQSFQDEIGDACEFFWESTYEVAPPFTFNVQRLWSNKSARAGHNPCVPGITGEAYYNTTTFANQMDTINVDETALAPAGACTPATCSVPTKGFKVPLGESRSFDIGFYSDAPTSDWTVLAFALPTLPVPDATGSPALNGTVEVTVDRPTGNNGHKARVTVRPLTSGALGVQYIELQSGYGQYDEAHTLPILIGQN